MEPLVVAGQRLPGRVAAHMPDALWWWASGALVVAMMVLVVGLLWWRLEPLTAGARLGRRSYDPRGSRQRTWARRRDLRDLTRASRRTAGFSIGTAAGRPLFAAPESHLAVVAPTRSGKTTRCVIPLLNSMLHGAIERPRDTTLRVLLDEAANIAPLRDLPTHLSQAAGYGIRIASIWQSVSQIEQRYRRDADTVLANSNSKLFMGPVTDEATRRYLVNVLGEIQVETTIVSVGTRGDQRTKSTAKRTRSAASAQDLQQLRQDRAILIDGANVPAVVALRPWWERRTVRRRAALSSAPASGPRRGATSVRRPRP